MAKHKEHVQHDEPAPAVEPVSEPTPSVAAPPCTKSLFRVSHRMHPEAAEVIEAPAAADAWTAWNNKHGTNHGGRDAVVEPVK